MDDDFLIQSSSNTLIQTQYSILLCPNCKINIPLITLTKSTDNTIITKIKCAKCKYNVAIPSDEYLTQIKSINELPHYCASKPNHGTLSTTKYCFNCQQWLCQSCVIDHKYYPSLSNHLFINSEIKSGLFCAIHNKKKNKLFCNECHQSLCRSCLANHSNHEVVDFKALENELKSCDFHKRLLEIETIRDQSLKSKEALIVLLDKEIDKWKEIKKDLNNAYSQYDINNEKIKELLILFQLNYEILKTTFSIDLYDNIKLNANINKEELIKINNENSSLESQCSNAIHYFNNNAIIHFGLSVQALSTIQAHDNEINCMIQLYDGRIITGSDDKTMKIWNINELKCEKIIQSLTEEIYAIVQINIEKIASGSSDFLIQLWNISNWNCFYTINGHSDSIFSLIVLNDTSLLSCSGDKGIKLWDLSELNCINTFLGHTQAVYVLLLLSSGIFASGSYDTTVKLWKSSKVECVYTLNGHSDYVTSLLELKDKRLASGSKDKTIILWNINTCTKVSIINVSRGIVFSLLQLRNSYLISGSYSDLTVWSLNSLRALSEFSSHSHYIKGIIELDDNRIVSCSCDKTIKIWTIK